MKRLFYIFLYLFCILGCSFLPLRAEDVLLKTITSPDKTSTIFDSFYENLSLQKNATPFLETDFGEIQILSSDSGTINLKVARFALNLHIKKEGYLSDPYITLTPIDNAGKANFFYPVTLPLDPQKGLVYSKNIAFPFTVDIIEPGKELSFAITFKYNWCTQDGCSPKEQKIKTSLNAAINYFSVYTAFIMSSMKNVPIKVNEKQMKASVFSTDSFWVSLNCDSNIKNVPTFMLLDSANKPITFETINQKIEKKQAIVTLKSTNMKDIANVIVYVNDRLYSQKLNQTTTPVPNIEDTPIEERTSIPFYMWLMFLLLSPSLALLFSLDFRNEIVARQILKNQLLGLTFGILSAVLIYQFLPYTYLINSKLWLSFCSVLFIYLILSQKKLTSFAYGVLTAIIPYFSLLSRLDISVPKTFSNNLYFFSILTIINLLPFILFLVKPIFAVQLNKRSYRNSTKLQNYPLIMDFLLFFILLCLCLFKS